MEETMDAFLYQTFNFCHKYAQVIGIVSHERFEALTGCKYCFSAKSFAFSMEYFLFYLCIQSRYLTKDMSNRILCYYKREDSYFSGYFWL